MVSQPDHQPSTSLALRGQASSVVGSRPSLSRARRYNRSHAGGVSYVPLNEFPVFSNSGDVEIVVRVASGHENRYLLHRHTLTRCSGFFEASTSNEWSRAQALPEPSPPPPPAALPSSHALAAGGELARIGEETTGSDSSGALRSSTAVANSAGGGGTSSIRKRWRYELDPGTGDGDIPMLVQKEESRSAAGNTASANSLFGGGQGGGGNGAGANTSAQRGHKTSSSDPAATHSNHGFFRSVADLSLGRHHHYNHQVMAPPPLPPPTQSEQDLLRDYDNLFRIMYNYPPVLDGVNIADAYVQCKSLLTLADLYDALAVVGPRVDHHLLQFQSRLWKQIAKYPISYLRLGYLARSKVIFQEALIHVVGQWPAGERSLRNALPETVLEIIEDKVDELEETVSRIEGRLFRLNLTTRSGERVTPSTSYLDWLAVSLFRQWLADNTTPAPGIVPERRGGGGSGGGGGGGTSSSRDVAGRHNNNSSSSNNHRGGGSSSSSASAAPAGQSLRVTTTVPPAVPPLASLGRTYRTLGATNGAAFLGHDECKRFLKLTPELYSRDNLRRFEKRVDELKAMARELVRPLMGSGLELDMGMGGGGGGAGRGGGADAIGYLTCTRVGDRDLPWRVDE